MAHISQRGPYWRAQVHRRGVRRSAEFTTKEEAEKWADDCERVILTDFFGEKQPPLQLSREEFTNIHSKAKENARQRAIPFNLHRDDVVTLYARSYGVCAVSGITFNTFRPAESTKRPWYPSLDRIDSKGPYTIENCRFVCVAVNYAIGEWGDWVLKAIARAMTYGSPGPLRVGEEAAAYNFKPIKGEATPRQLFRRKARLKSPTPDPLPIAP